jgi:hypothetical protein
VEAHVEAFPAPVEEQPEVSGSFQLFAFLVSAAGAPIPQISSSNQAWNNFIRSQNVRQDIALCHAAHGANLGPVALGANDRSAG